MQNIYKMNFLIWNKMGDAEEAADYARNHAQSKSIGQCAKYVADALINGGGFSF